ncbi:alpha/beta hydrolase [soil metagenome]
MNSSYAYVNGIRMYFEIHGDEPTGNIPLVLIHGGGSTIQTTFGRILPLLAKTRTIIAIEMQAHGRTDDRDTPSSFEQDADDTASLIKSILDAFPDISPTINKFDFLGFSNGGSDAMQVGIRHPELVNKLIIASAFYKREGLLPGFFEGMQHASLDNMPADLKNAYLKEMEEFISGTETDNSKVKKLAGERLIKMFIRDKTRMLEFKDWKDEDLKSIKAPTLLISGDKDVATLEHTVKMSQLISDCRLAILPGGHGDYLGEITTLKSGKWKQKWVVKLIEEFLKT